MEDAQAAQSGASWRRRVLPPWTSAPGKCVAAIAAWCSGEPLPRVHVAICHLTIVTSSNAASSGGGDNGTQCTRVPPSWRRRGSEANGRGCSRDADLIGYHVAAACMHPNAGVVTTSRHAASSGGREEVAPRMGPPPSCSAHTDTPDARDYGRVCDVGRCWVDAAHMCATAVDMTS